MDNEKNGQLTHFLNVGSHSPNPCEPVVTTRVMSLNIDAETIAIQNDMLRVLGVNGECYMSRKFAVLAQDERLALLQAIREFDDFNEDNDPYGKHDSGMVEVNDYCVFWRIDYYDKDKAAVSQAPWDSAVTTRVLNITLDDER